MSIDGRAKGYGTIWSDWTIGELLGHGSGGKTAVYKLTRVNHGFIEEDVLKVVNIIEEDLGIADMSEDFKQNYLIREKESVEKAEGEVNLMHKLRNCNNIVTYQDFKFHSTHDEHLTAVDLLIRMHKYTDLNSVIKRTNLSQQDIVKVGIDICTALEGCINNGIIHRDIKPENIFFDGNQYLLGDFGISRILENGFMAQTSKGTPPYAAPEQFENLRPDTGYDYRVDIYSLGLTLYVLANKGKLPFMDMFSSVNNALMMRLSGNKIPPIKGCDSKLNRIILRACEFNAEERYHSATEMKEDLQDLYRVYRKNGVNISILINDVDGLINNETEPALGGQTSYETEPALGGQTSYETEPALGGQTSYETEPALGGQISYETEPALGGQTSYETEPALGGQTSYETEPALGGQTSHAPQSMLKGYEELDDLQSMAEDSVALFQEKRQSKFINDVENVHNNTNAKDHNSIIDYKTSAIKAIQEGNNDKALEMIKRIAVQGDFDAMYYEVANFYSDEIKLKVDSSNAIFWYKKCIEYCRDSWTISLAEYQLGEIYAKGLGVKKDYKIAEAYFASSAAKGNPYAKKKFVAGHYIKK